MISEQLKQVSDNSSLFSSYDVEMIANVLENLLLYFTESRSTEDNVFDTLDNVFDTSESVMKNSETANSTSSRFVMNFCVRLFLVEILRNISYCCCFFVCLFCFCFAILRICDFAQCVFGNAAVKEIVFGIFPLEEILCKR